MEPLEPRESRAFEYLNDNEDAHLRRIMEFVQQPTISTEDIGIVEGAWLLKGYLQQAGFDEVELVETDGYPGIWAAVDAGADRTVASYGFFDSRPVGPRPWTYRPFAGRMVDDAQHGRVIVGRGASSPKGPLMAWINALEAMIRTDTLPVNVMMLIEGEEILGSPHYGSMFDKYRNRLAGADAVFTGGMSQGGTGGVSVHLGYRGFLVLELCVSGRRWGRGPREMSVHSSLKTVLDSPASHLVHALASLTDHTGSEILIPGLDHWDAVVPDEDTDIVEDLLSRSDNVSSLLGVGSMPTKGGLDGRDLLLEFLYSPTININGIAAGYTGPGSEVFTLPEQASARVDMRLPPGLTCERALACLNEHLRDRGFADVNVRVIAAHDPFRIPRDADIVRATMDTYRSMGLDPAVWPYAGGGGPWSLFWHELGLPVVFNAGVGGGGRRDRGDEYLLVDGTDRVCSLVEAERSHIDILHRYAGI